MSRFFSKSWGIGALLAVIAMGVAGPAHAGLVTGRWDPPFGSFLPGLNWEIQAQFQVPGTCSSLANGDYSTASGACAGATTVNFYLRLFNNSADPNNFFESDANSSFIDFQAATVGLNGGYAISQVRVQDGQIIGFVAGVGGADAAPQYSGFPAPTENNGHAYGASLGLNGPSIVCYQCGVGSTNVFADLSDLTQFLVTYNSNDTSDPKFKDTNGNALGAVLDANGQYIGQGTSPNAVPEPGALALVLLGLGAAGAAGRRKG